eukprot:1142387-Pelagomonas_calceolata.AAC.1
MGCLSKIGRSQQACSLQLASFSPRHKLTCMHTHLALFAFSRLKTGASFLRDRSISTRQVVPIELHTACCSGMHAAINSDASRHCDYPYQGPRP